MFANSWDWGSFIWRCEFKNKSFIWPPVCNDENISASNDASTKKYPYINLPQGIFCNPRVKLPVNHDWSVFDIVICTEYFTDCSSVQILLHLPTFPPSLTNWSLYCEYLLIIFLLQVYNIARKIGNENTIWVFRSTYFLRNLFQMFILFRKQCIKLQEKNGYFFPLSCRLGVLKEISTVWNSLCNFSV